MTPLILNTNFIEQKSKIGYPQVLNWNPPDWEPTVMTITPGSTYSMMESLKNFIYPSTGFWNNPGDSSLPLNCANALKIHSKRPEQHQTPTKTKLHLLNHLQTLHTHTKLRQPAYCCVGLRRRYSRNKKWNSSAL